MWGNSLAVRIPKALAEETHLSDGCDVDVVARGGRLVLVRARRRYGLAQMLSLVTDDNRHGEVVTGPPVGREVQDRVAAGRRDRCAQPREQGERIHGERDGAVRKRPLPAAQ